MGRTTHDERRRFLTGTVAGLGSLALGGACTAAAASGLVPTGGGRGGGGAMPEGNGAATRFTGQVVLITGATSGIGEATARAFAAEGARVFFCGRRRELGEQVAQQIRAAGGEARFMQADVREEQQMAGFVAACVETYGGLDVAFNNAGIEGPRGTFDELPLGGENGYRDVMRTNLDGVFFAMRHEIPVMRQRGGGVIINTASVQTTGGSRESGTYAASKYGVVGLSLSAALDHAGDDIRVLALSPGAVDTPLLRRLYPDLRPIAQAIPQRRIATPEEIAAVVLNLASPAFRFMTGTNVVVDGGSSA